MAAAAHAATPGPAAELSPDGRPVLLLQAPQSELLLVHHAALLPEHRARLPPVWHTGEPDRGFSAALLMQLSHVAANWPWRTLIISTSGPESDSQLQSLGGEDAVVAVVKEELVDLRGRVQFHVTMDLVTVRAIATRQETRARTPVQYFAPELAADSRLPRRSQAAFAVDGTLDGQVSTAATDLSQFLATFVARVSVPASLRAHNPTLGELGAHPVCRDCRPSDSVVYQQPGRVWVRVAKTGGSILALPLQSARPAASRNKEFGSQAFP
ncbi:MAG TPA: hypothetical protein VGV09_11335 [Steroidobacteraceae bacterium]|nr:hypothetical protein [Steroidobacteraceae bacterium]